MTSVQQQQHEAWKARALRLGIIQPQKPVYIPNPKAIREARRREVIDRVDAWRTRFRGVLVARRRLFLAPIELARPSLASIAREVAEKHNVTLHDMKSARRQPWIVSARHEFFYRARNETPHSYPKIGEFLGRKDHSTVMHGVRKWEKRLEAGDV